ncbi:hypothetical protein FJN14_08225 [Alteromonas mediterranea]|uniref:hypothetical protein n=1 Tax=Alteromonas mediterranea TaxID=314275 RepID=UPI001131E435|nr:hypothetical protein [Alteromonas mediterranea]QDG38432.1 hypothetical protein FJN14_08225 [Alteromonas mediterranea]
MDDMKFKEAEFLRQLELEHLEKTMEYEYYEDIKARRRRTLMIILATLAPLPIFFVKFLDLPENLTYGALGAVILAMVGLTFIYLQPERSRRYTQESGYVPNELKEEFLSLKSRNRDFERQNKELRNKIDKIINQIQKGDGTEGLFNKDDKQKILDRIQNKLESEALQDYQAKLQALTNDRLKFKNQEELFLQISSRLESEVQNLSKRGNVNLILGMATTLSGLGILGYSVFNAPNLNSTLELASHFIPRISLVLLIEVFAYFFLKLYKQSLNEIKYFQNEITNIESKFLGLRISVESEQQECLKEVVSNLLSTERNFVLEKGQTTIELEQLRNEQQRNELTGLLDKALNKVK